MRCVIVGAGPTGLVLGMGLAHRGHDVTVVERDPGPQADGSWPRRGVMQFHHAHGIRPHVGQVLMAEAPTAYERVLQAGAEPVPMTLPDGSVIAGGLRCRRSTLERAIREAALATAGLTLRPGNVERVTAHAGRADGIQVDGANVAADLVVDASGRVGRVCEEWREPSALGGDTGIAYVDRQYQLLPGAEPGPLNGAVAWVQDFVGFQVLVFLHERGIFSVLLVRPADDQRLRGLRHEAAFEAACAAIPGLAAWTDPERARPITPVLVGGRLLNHYRSQRGPGGGSGAAWPVLRRATQSRRRRRTSAAAWPPRSCRCASCCGCSTSHGPDLGAPGRRSTRGARRTCGPGSRTTSTWTDALRRRWAGEDVDLSERVPSDLIMAAMPADPRIGEAMAPYLTMTALPSCLDAVEPLARAVYESGWRPSLPTYPTRDDLAAIVAEREPQTEAIAS